MKYVIIGGDAAGMSAAMQVYKYDKDAKITIIEAGDYYSYIQCGIPYVISEDVPSKEHLIARDVDTYREEFGMNALTQHHVERIDIEKKTVTGSNLTNNKAFTIEYDKLLIASGASPIVPKWKGVDLSNVHILKTLPHMEEIMEDLTDEVKDVTIIGGGYIGLEMAESFTKRNKKVTIINRSSYLGSIFDQDMAEHIHEEAEKHGVNLVFNENTEEIIGDAKVEYVVTDKGKHPTDLLLISIGVTPNTSFLEGVDIQLTSNKAIVVNEQMETTVTDVYAAGDCATQYNRIKKQNDYVPLGTHANKQGRIAGMNMSNQKRSFKGIVGSSIIKFFNITLGKTGLSEEEAKQMNIQYDTITLKSKDRSAYYPNAKTIHIKLIYKRDSMKLLGGQVIGEAGVDKRIDVLAVALFNEMTVQQLEDLDLSYAPPYNTAWDPVQQAARHAQK